MSPAQRGRYMDELADALADGRRGADPWADEMIAEAEEMLERRRSAGRRGGLKKAENRAAGSGEVATPSNATATPSNATATAGKPLDTHDTHTHKTHTQDTHTRQTEPNDSARARGRADGSGSVLKSGFSWSEIEEDRGRYIWSLADGALADFAVWYCREEGNARAVAVYRKFVRQHGAREFRFLLDRFTGACAAGEEPDSRGAAFMAMVAGRARDLEGEKGQKAEA